MIDINNLNPWKLKEELKRIKICVISDILMMIPAMTPLIAVLIFGSEIAFFYYFSIIMTICFIFFLLISLILDIRRFYYMKLIIIETNKMKYINEKVNNFKADLYAKVNNLHN